VSSPELSVVCRSCGEEVSPYVTECPYCGTRLRKRAPDLGPGKDAMRSERSRRGGRRKLNPVGEAKPRRTRPPAPQIDRG